MGSRWRKAKMALGINLCVHVPMAAGDSSPSDDLDVSSGPSDADLGSSTPLRLAGPVPRSSSSNLSRSASRSSKRICAICLGAMRAGNGHALFTAECSHAFHFHCIASNVNHGNHLCPVCRAKWKEVPFQPPVRDNRVNPVNSHQDDTLSAVPRRPPRANSLQHHSAVLRSSEPTVFDDDEPLDPQQESVDAAGHACTNSVTCTTYPEFPAVQRSASQESFAILVHLRAPVKNSMQDPGLNVPFGSPVSQGSRAPVDLVTVLDVSGSMSGTKLALLKRAMGFVIQNLGPSDRLSVVAFSSTARRLFPLQRMSDAGKQQALQAVNALMASGGTNIADGLGKAVKVIEERKLKNAICSIILLSDGQDTYSLPAAGSRTSQPDYRSLLPSSMRGVPGVHHVPVHAFGFGSDHDSASLHSISETSGGTFSFIEAESVMQDAFAQCIGGLLSVVVQELHVGVECAHPLVRIGSVKSGGYSNDIAEDRCNASIEVGDLYADEERDFMIYVNVPVASEAREDTMLLKVRCSYRDCITKEVVDLDVNEVGIRRPAAVIGQSVSIEVDRQRNRLRAAEAMAEARTAAEKGMLSNAVSILDGCRQSLAETPSARSGDRLCIALDAELKEMQERMASRQRYEASGRAYMLSGLSSHSWQRATARGDSTDSTSLVQSYQTPSMVDMLIRSQTMALAPSSNPPRPPARSASSQQR